MCWCAQRVAGWGNYPVLAVQYLNTYFNKVFDFLTLFLKFISKKFETNFCPALLMVAILLRPNVVGLKSQKNCWCINGHYGGVSLKKVANSGGKIPEFKKSLLSNLNCLNDFNNFFQKLIGGFVFPAIVVTMTLIETI